MSRREAWELYGINGREELRQRKKECFDLAYWLRDYVNKTSSKLDPQIEKSFLKAADLLEEAHDEYVYENPHNGEKEGADT